MPWAVQGRMLVYAIIYSLGATRCIILHLATSESLQHATGGEDGSLMLCGLAVAFVSLALVQVRPTAHLITNTQFLYYGCGYPGLLLDIDQSLSCNGWSLMYKL